MTAAAEIRLKDGRAVSTRIEYATGEPENPVPREALVDKFISLAANLVPEGTARSLAGDVLRMDEQGDVSGLIGRLCRAVLPTQPPL